MAAKAKIAKSTVYTILERAGVGPKHRGPRLGAALENRLTALLRLGTMCDARIAAKLGWPRRRVRYHRERLHFAVVYENPRGQELRDEDREPKTQAPDRESLRASQKLDTAEQRWGAALGSRAFESRAVVPLGRMSSIPEPVAVLRSCADL